MAETKCTVTTKDSKGNPKKFEISKDTFFIGRADTCEISLPIKGISRQHLEVLVRGESIYLKDLNSSNGTRLNAVPLVGGVETLYSPGDEVWLGPSDFPMTFAIPASAQTHSAIARHPGTFSSALAPVVNAAPAAAAPVALAPTPAPAPSGVFNPQPQFNSPVHSAVHSPVQSAVPVAPAPYNSSRPPTPFPASPAAQPFAQSYDTSASVVSPANQATGSVLVGRPGISFPPPPAPIVTPSMPYNSAPPVPRSPVNAPSASAQIHGVPSGMPPTPPVYGGAQNYNQGSAAVAYQPEPSIIRDTPSIIRENGALNRESEARLKQVEQQAGYILQEAKIKADNILSQARLEARNEAARVEQEAHRMFEEAEDHANEVRKTAELESEQILQMTQKKSLTVLDDANQTAASLQNKVRTEVALLKKESERQAELMIGSAREQARELRQKLQTEYDEALSSARKRGDEEYQKLVTTAKEEVVSIKARNDSLYKENRLLEEKRDDLNDKVQAINQAVIVREKELREVSAKYDEKKKSTAEFDETFDKAKRDHENVVKLVEDQRTHLEKTAARVKELEERKIDFESFADKELASARAHQSEELKKRRDQILIDHEKLKGDLDKEMAEARRKEMEKIQNLRQEEVKMMKERRHVHAVEIARAIEMFLRPLMNEALPPASTPDTLKGFDRTLEPLIRRVMGAEEADRSGSTAEQILTASADERSKKKWQSARRIAVCVAFLGLVLIGFFRPVWFSDFAKRISGDEQRTEFFKAKAKSTYSPAQDDNYRSSYAENFLYLKDYAKYKSDPQARKNWVLSLNNLFIQDLGLSENLAINFVGQESAMTDTLLQERDMIDPGFLKIGLDRMTRSEFDSIQSIRKIIVKEQDWRKIRDLDHEMYREWLHR